MHHKIAGAAVLALGVLYPAHAVNTQEARVDYTIYQPGATLKVKTTLRTDGVGRFETLVYHEPEGEAWPSTAVW